MRCGPLDLWFKHFPLLGNESFYILMVPYLLWVCIEFNTDNTVTHKPTTYLCQHLPAENLPEGTATGKGAGDEAAHRYHLDGVA